jgi:hypothetical protein
MIAIVIPYYNYQFFEQTLESLAAQTDKRFKVYVGNDYSPNDPTDILLKFETLISLEYHRYNNNLGQNSLSEHWNRCVSLVNDESWILILGDDDKLGKNVIEEFYKNYSDIQDSDSSLIRLPSVLIDERNDFISEVFHHPKNELAKDSLLRKLKKETRSSLSEYIFYKRVFEKYKFKHYASAWHSDDMAWLEFSKNKPIYTLNNAVAYVRFANHSISGKKENIKSKVEATYMFFIDILKMNLKFTEDELSFLVSEFIFFLRLRKKFSVSISVFLVSVFLKKKQYGASISIIKEYLLDKKINLKKSLKSKFKKDLM